MVDLLDGCGRDATAVEPEELAGALSRVPLDRDRLKPKEPRARLTILGNRPESLITETKPI